jgi:hypothetical protein
MPVEVDGVVLETCMKRDWKRLERLKRKQKKAEAADNNSSEGSSTHAAMILTYMILYNGKNKSTRFRIHIHYFVYTVHTHQWLYILIACVPFMKFLHA